MNHCITHETLANTFSLENLEAELGVLTSDQALFLEPRTKPLVQVLAKDKEKFSQDFAVVMDQMGSMGVKRGRRHGEKRIDGNHITTIYHLPPETKTKGLDKFTSKCGSQTCFYLF